MVKHSVRGQPDESGRVLKAPKVQSGDLYEAQGKAWVS